MGPRAGSRALRLVAVVIVSASALWCAAPARAGAPPSTTGVPPTTTEVLLPLVTLGGLSDATITRGPADPCSSQVVDTVEDGSIEVRRSGAAGLAGDLEVEVRLSGPGANAIVGGVSRVGGVIPDGSASVRIPVVPVWYLGPADLELTVTVMGSDAYLVGAPRTGTLMIHLDDVPPACPKPVYSAASANTLQTIQVGAPLAPLDFEWFPHGAASTFVLSGALPPGLVLEPDGTFSGAAAAAGTYEAVIAACLGATPPAPPHLPSTVQPESCALTTLTVVVTPRSGPAFPATG